MAENYSDLSNLGLKCGESGKTHTQPPSQSLSFNPVQSALMGVQQPLESPFINTFPSSNGRVGEANNNNEFGLNQPLITTEGDNVVVLPANNVGLEDAIVTKKNTKNDQGSIEGKKRTRLSIEQTALLQAVYQDHNNPDKEQKSDLANVLNLTPKQVGVWFQNKRICERVKQNEIDVERLSQENESLKREIIDLRALNLEPLQKENKRLKEENDEIKARDIEPLKEENEILKKEINNVRSRNLSYRTNVNHTPASFIVCPCCQNVRISPSFSSTAIFPARTPFNGVIKQEQDIWDYNN